MIDVGAALSLLLVAAQKQPFATTVGDYNTLSALGDAVKKSGKLDLAVMIRDKTVVANLEAINRTSALALALLKDPQHAAATEALLASLAF